MPKVYIVGGDHATEHMYLRVGWKVSDTLDETVDVIQFTGGADVSPSYYGEARHPTTNTNPARDLYEASVYRDWVGRIPMVGICRGGQFLNVMNGGKLWQHVTNHGIGGTHEAFCRVSESPVQVTSTHHQMMIPSPTGKVLMFAQICQSKASATEVVNGLLSPDVEAVYYPETKTLCFQPHPEFVNINHECQLKYFEYLEKFIL